MKSRGGLGEGYRAATPPEVSIGGDSGRNLVKIGELVFYINFG